MLYTFLAVYIAYLTWVSELYLSTAVYSDDLAWAHQSGSRGGRPELACGVTHPAESPYRGCSVGWNAGGGMAVDVGALPLASCKYSRL